MWNTFASLPVVQTPVTAINWSRVLISLDQSAINMSHNTEKWTLFTVWRNHNLYCTVTSNSISSSKNKVFFLFYLQLELQQLSRKKWTLREVTFQLFHLKVKINILQNTTYNYWLLLIWLTTKKTFISNAQ